MKNILRFVFLATASWGISLLADEYTPVLFSDMLLEIEKKSAAPWVPPDYSNQEKTLGYQKDAFAVPKGMEPRVKFWTEIFSKYSTDQGVLHDSRYVDVIYEDVDFTDIMKNTSLDIYQKEKARRKRVDDAKDRIRDRLKRLQKLTSSQGLSGEDLRYWNLFKDADEKNKFTEAAKEGRLRFQLGQSDRFIKGIYQSGRFIREMEQIFREEGLPIELIRMVYVESSFNLKARSKVGASGIWQFMRRTGKEYLKIDREVDERNDPLLATRAAAKKLKSNYRMLESWPLAVTGYNHGAYGIRRLVRKAGTTDIAELTDVRRGTFGFASASFYASFLAALEVERNATKYFGPVTMARALGGREIRLAKPLDHKKVLEWFGADSEKAKEFNPHIVSSYWSGRRFLRKGHMIRVPAEKYTEIVAELSKYKVPESQLKVGETHVVASGETLSEIAERYKVSTPILMKYNRIPRPKDLQAGQVLEIPIQ